MTNDHIRTEETTRLIKCLFSNEEKQVFGEELANGHTLRTAAQNDLDTVKKQIGARVTEADNIIALCVEKIRSGFEMRREPCTVVKDFKVNTLRVTRDATGEVLEERTMTSEEAQMPLFDEEEHPASDAQGDETEEAAAADPAEEESGTGGIPDESATATTTGEGLEREVRLDPGKSYDVSFMAGIKKKKKKTLKDLKYEETKTKGEKTRCVFKDANGKGHLIDPKALIEVKPTTTKEGEF